MAKQCCIEDLELNEDAAAKRWPRDYWTKVHCPPCREETVRGWSFCANKGCSYRVSLTTIPYSYRSSVVLCTVYLSCTRYKLRQLYKNHFSGSYAAEVIMYKVCKGVIVDDWILSRSVRTTSRQTVLYIVCINLEYSCAEWVLGATRLSWLQ